jgi:hypothetical protein
MCFNYLLLFCERLSSFNQADAWEIKFAVELSLLSDLLVCSRLFYDNDDDALLGTTTLF